MKTILAALLLVALPLAAQDFGQVGTSGAQLLKINFDPRASALGYAAASMVDNVGAVHTNIAGTASIKKGDVSFTYLPWFAGIKMMSAAVAYRVEDIGVFTFQGTGFSTDEEVTTVDRENGTGEKYSISNLVLGVGFARHIMDNLAIGVQAKYYRESYFGHAAKALAFDLGTVYQLGFSGARMAMTLQNFGPEVEALSGSYDDYSDSNLKKSFSSAPLPVTFRVSFSLEPFTGEGYRVRLAADLVHPNDNVEHYNVGGEVVLYEALALRGGVKLNYDDETFAVGVGFLGGKLLGQGIRIDYSYEKYKILSSVQKVSIGFSL